MIMVVEQRDEEGKVEAAMQLDAFLAPRSLDVVHVDIRQVASKGTALPSRSSEFRMNNPRAQLI